MKTIGDLELRKFVTRDGKVVESTKKDVPIATRIDMETFMESKPYFTQSKLVPLNSHEVLQSVFDTISEYMPDKDRKWGDVTIYRDKLDIHGYVEKARDNSKFRLLTPDVPVSEVAFERIITKVPVIGDADHSACIAIKWEPSHCQIAFGLNVGICDNYNIFGGDSIIETSRGFSYEAVMEKVKELLRKVEQKFKLDIATIHKLTGTKLNDRTTRYLIGDLVQKYSENTPVINLTDIHSLSRGIVKRKQDGSEATNMWDFTNAGTEVLRFDNGSGESALEHIAAFNKYVLDVIENSAKKN